MASNRWAIREIANASFYSLVDNRLLTYLDSLKSSGIENTAETVYARGGRGNPRLVGFSSDREATINLEDALFSNEALALMTGNDLIEGGQEVFRREVLTVNGNSATLKKAPLNEELISLYILNLDGSHGDLLEEGVDTDSGDFILNTKDITFAEDRLSEGDKVAAYFKVKTGEKTKKIRVSSDSFAGSFRVVLDCLVRDAYNKKDYAAQIEIHNAKLEDNWEMTMAPDGDPSTFTMTLQALKSPTSDDLYTMTIYDDDEVA